MPVICLNDVYTLTHARNLRQRAALFLELVPKDRTHETAEAVKRIVDLLGAAAGLLLLSPLLLGFFVVLASACGHGGDGAAPSVRAAATSILKVLWVASGVDPKNVWKEMDRRERLFGIAEKLLKSPPEKLRPRVAALPMRRLQKRRRRDRSRAGFGKSSCWG